MSFVHGHIIHSAILFQLHVSKNNILVTCIKGLFYEIDNYEYLRTVFKRGRMFKLRTFYEGNITGVSFFVAYFASQFQHRRRRLNFIKKMHDSMNPRECME